MNDNDKLEKLIEEYITFEDKELNRLAKKLNTQRYKYTDTNKGSYATRARYQKSLGLFLRHLVKNTEVKDLRDIEPRHLDSFVNKRIAEGRTAATIKTDLSAIRFMHKHIPDPKHDYLPTNKDLGVEDRVTALQKGRPFSNDEKERFFELAERYNRADVYDAALLADKLGLRINETIALRKDRLEEAKRTGVLRLTSGTKGGRKRSIPIDTKEKREVINYLNNKTERGNYVVAQERLSNRHRVKHSIQDFVNDHRDKYQDESKTLCKVKIKGREEEVERPLSFHSFRYGFAQNEYNKLIDKGIDVKKAELTVSQLLGHNRAEVTRRYL